MNAAFRELSRYEFRRPKKSLEKWFSMKLDRILLCADQMLHHAFDYDLKEE